MMVFAQPSIAYCVSGSSRVSFLYALTVYTHSCH